MKFGQYLEANLTPEWKRAYIDYRGCKKKIKVVAARLAAEQGGGGGGRRQEDVAKDEDSSDNDHDHGPSAPPNSVKSRPRNSSSIGGATPSTNRPNGQTPRSGKLGSSPLAIKRTTSNPPPLDIGESSYKDPSHMSASTPRKGVAFSPLLGTSGPNNASGSGSDYDGRDIGPSALSRSGGTDTGSRQSDVSSENGKGAMSTVSQEPILPTGNNTQTTSPKPYKSSPSIKSPRFTLGRNSNTNSPRDSNIAQSPSLLRARRSLRSMTHRSPSLYRAPTRSADNFEALYDQLEPDEQDFFDFLDNELDKVEKFFVTRQQEAVLKAHELRDQCRELAEHRKLYHEIYPDGQSKWEAQVEHFLPINVGAASAPYIDYAAQKLHLRHKPHPDPHSEDSQPNGKHDVTSKRKDASPVRGDLSPSRLRDMPGTTESPEDRENLKRAMMADKEHTTYNPERYQKYKAELRKAVLEFYRQLELIKNYRIMNLTGFRKALKKFEKVSNVHCMEMYTDERILTDEFSKGQVIEDLLKEMETLFSVHFEHGDAKKARDRLRNQDHPGTTHYRTMFRSGLYLGIGLIAAIQAVVEAAKPETQILLPDWDGLLQVYAALYLPVIFSILFELNLAAYVGARINYEFVMELSRPTLDARSYLEIPSFLFLTLSICMYFSYYRIGNEHVAYTTWPAGWLVFVVVFFLNPFPIFRRRSRYWFLRTVFRVFTPGYSRVEFIAFFLADELNSLVYTIQTIMFLSCSYGKHWPVPIYSYCASGATWPYILISIIPGLIRFIQCVKRYADSGLKIHLVNAGKYSFTMIYYSFYVWWRIRGSHINDGVFVVWAILATCYSTYTSTWDLTVDWSLFRKGSGMLRPDLAYPRWVYYPAMVTNVLIRFVWIWYIPDQARHTRLRTFFFALAEMLRRWQWNFFRVETEHLGNADAYRVTREIPLPYRRSEAEEAYERAEAEAESKSQNKDKEGKMSVRLRNFKRRITGLGHPGESADAPDANAGESGIRRAWEARDHSGFARTTTRPIVNSPEQV